MDGFEVGWRDDQGEHRLPLADAVSVQFEAGRPVRSFPSYRRQRHFPGSYWSSTTGGHVGFESWLERDHAMLVDFTPQVTGLLSQPLWLFWEDVRGKRVSHAPDYFARFEDGRGLVVDCRPLDRIDGAGGSKVHGHADGLRERRVGLPDGRRSGRSPDGERRLAGRLQTPSTRC
ncbi:TnsA-like heteromeric transposase endonuclease subunit [Streptomyces microflavus]|uniref:TnsA-like heteromeric transposase endonuclease subunit n=1 Tax=Streptomyces microflavus TaxID=1919 RepID=UPI00381FC473